MNADKPTTDKSAVEFFNGDKRKALDVPIEVMDGAGLGGLIGGEDDRASGSESETDEILSGHDKASLAVGREAYDATFAAQRCSDVEISGHVECQSLGPTQATIEDANRAVRIDLIHGVEAGDGRAGDKQRARWSECEVIGGDARLERGKNVDLAVAGNALDGAAAVTDVEVLFSIEGQAGGYAHAFRV